MRSLRIKNSSFPVLWTLPYSCSNNAPNGVCLTWNRSELGNLILPAVSNDYCRALKTFFAHKPWKHIKHTTVTLPNLAYPVASSIHLSTACRSSQSSYSYPSAYFPWLCASHDSKPAASYRNLRGLTACAWHDQQSGQWTDFKATCNTNGSQLPPASEY